MPSILNSGADFYNPTRERRGLKEGGGFFSSKRP
jgi:hypothetical protein